MFADTFAMLEASDPIFSAKETQKIMHYLESQLVPLLNKFRKSIKNGNTPDGSSTRMAEWEPLLQKAVDVQQHKASNSTGISKTSLVDNISFMIKIIRCACIRNLSRSIILENTVIDQWTL